MEMAEAGRYFCLWWAILLLHTNHRFVRRVVKHKRPGFDLRHQWMQSRIRQLQSRSQQHWMCQCCSWVILLQVSSRLGGLPPLRCYYWIVFQILHCWGALPGNYSYWPSIGLYPWLHLTSHLSIENPQYPSAVWKRSDVRYGTQRRA
jgi:hypothetical protein